MEKKILIPLYGDEVSPRFDQAAEVLIATWFESSAALNEKVVVLSKPSAEKLCHLIITEGVQTVICGGIEEEYYQYLKWKRVEVIDSVIGFRQTVLDSYIKGTLQAWDNLLTL